MNVVRASPSSNVYSRTPTLVRPPSTMPVTMNSSEEMVTNWPYPVTPRWRMSSGAETSESRIPSA